MSHSSHSRKKAHPVITAFLITAAILILLAVSIAISWEHIYNVRKNATTPYDYPGSVWKSEDPVIELEVSDDSRDITASDCRIYLEGKAIRVVFSPGFYPQKATFRRPGSSEDLLVCKAKFSETEVILTVTEDAVFEGKYEKIILKRQK